MSSCRVLRIVSLFFTIQSYLNANMPLFESYLTSDTGRQPVHLRNHSQEKAPLFTDMTILHLDVPSRMPIETVADRVLYSDVDVIHLTHVSTHDASGLYELLQESYAHFIYIPTQEQGIFIASKYPLSQAEISASQEGQASSKGYLEFSIQGGNPYPVTVDSNDAPMTLNLIDHDQSSTTPCLLIDMPGTLTVLKQEFSPSRSRCKARLLAAETFQIIPIKDKGNSHNRGRCKGEVEIEYSWGGEDRGHWTGGVRVEAYDKRGNYVEAEVKQNDKGEGAVNARAGHEEK